MNKTSSKQREIYKVILVFAENLGITF